MRRLDHINIIQLRYFFFSSEDKVSDLMCLLLVKAGNMSTLLCCAMRDIVACIM